MGAVRNTEGPLINSDLLQIGSPEGVKFFNTTRPPKVEPLDTDEDYIVQENDRYDLLAYRRLGADREWWVIFERNTETDMRLWPNDFVPGTTIKIPTRDSIRQRGIAP